MPIVPLILGGLRLVGQAVVKGGSRILQGVRWGGRAAGRVVTKNPVTRATITRRVNKFADSLQPFFGGAANIFVGFVLTPIAIAMAWAGLQGVSRWLIQSGENIKGFFDRWGLLIMLTAATPLLIQLIIVIRRRSK